MHTVSICLATALLLAPAAGNAQNKCVDAKGKVVYQQDPCPGSAPAKPPAAPAKPAGPARAVAPPPSSGPSPAAAASPAATPEPPARNARDRAQLDRECAAARRQIADMRTNRSQVAPHLLQTFDANLARAELQYGRNCQ